MIIIQHVDPNPASSLPVTKKFFSMDDAMAYIDKLVEVYGKFHYDIDQE